ncbi:related to GCP3 (gamma-tubulin complex) [Phialocephala subalpina]|uniref:Spindle pole body component n=1 Tax=Phialocephala subalpina TaxID=576137 RepID=A0A1L7WVE5_9HELO|nr:related to GCP3 (gamma-tubulin complex) [Phialocephala subalpina]
MAHLAKLGALTDELVTLITLRTATSDLAQFNIHRESALRALRHHNHPRTNQFDVTSQLDGLEEKLRVYNEDPLADALRERLNTLSSLEVKWAPEILHLLLALSDDPVRNSKLKDLDFLKEPEPDEGPRLQWKDLCADDPLLREKKIWANVDFGAESSDGEDGYDDSRSEASGSTDLTGQSSVEEDPSRRPEDYAVDTISKEGLEILRNEQFWQKIPIINGVRLETVRRPISEIQAIREVLFMLGGLPTSIFEMPTPTTMEPSKSFVLKTASPDAFLKLSKSFAQQGSAILLLRSWVKRTQSIHLLQAFQGSISERLAQLDKLLAETQLRFVAPQDDIIVSLLAIHEDFRSYTRPLSRLSEMVKKLDEDQYAHAFRYLEVLYDETCTSQMAGDDEMYAFMGKIFFECLQVYLRPIRTWMEDGELRRGDKVFFVLEAVGDIEPASIWESRFKIRRTQGGILHAPRFLHATANKIFNTGKSVVVLKHLKQFGLLQAARTGIEPILDFDTVCNPTLLGLCPFPELFDSAFDSWIQSKHHQASSLLRKTLFDSCGLHTALDAMSHIYFIADGITGSKFTNYVFDKLDTLNSSWNDRFTLTELCQSTFGTLPSVSTDRIRMTVLPLNRKHQDVAKCRRSLKALSILEIKYHLAWPIQTIITPATMSSYRKIFTFLLQIRRSTHILSRQRLIVDTLMQNSGTDERALYYSLRMRLLWFNQMLYYYLTSLVLEPCTQKMQADLKAAADVDAMIQVHSAYLKTTIDQALLGSKLQLIHKTILKILELGIELEDAQAANAAADKQTAEQQQEMMDLSMASLGLHTPRKKAKPVQDFRRSVRSRTEESSSEEEEYDHVDLSILSSPGGDDEDELFVEKLRKMKSEFDRLVHFVASGLKGVARAGGSNEARSWDTLAEMLESGMGSGVTVFR